MRAILGLFLLPVMALAEEPSKPSSEIVSHIQKRHLEVLAAFIEQNEFGARRMIPNKQAFHTLKMPNGKEAETIELMGMFKPDEPKAYRAKSENLRSLTQLEQRGVERILKGETLLVELEAARPVEAVQRVQQDASKNVRAGRSLVALGPIHATKQCQACHKVAEGTVIGAFSYRFDEEVLKAEIRSDIEFQKQLEIIKRDYEKPFTPVGEEDEK